MLVLTVRLWLGGALLGMVASTMACGAQGLAQASAGVEVSDVGVGVFAGDRLAELPVDARQWESMELLGSAANAVTVAAGGSGDGEADLADGRGNGEGAPAAGVSYGGLSPVQNSATVDGLSMEQNFGSTLRGCGGRGASGSSGAGIGASFGQGAVRSFRVMPGTYSAAFGDAAGAVTAIRSRAGTEVWHGEGFGSVRSSALAAYNPFSVVTRYRDGVVTNFLVKPDDTLVQVGGHLGGPLGDLLPAMRLKKRLTVFGSFEEQLRDDPAISSPAMVGFYALTATQVALLGNRGVSAAATEAALNYLDSLTGTVARSSTRAVGFVRVDERVSRRDSVVATYAGNRFDLPAGTGFRSASNAVVNSGMASVGDQTVTMDAVAMHWVHAFSPGFTHVLRAQWVHDLEFDTPRAPLAQEPAISPGGFAPEVEIAPNGFSYGTPANLGRAAYPDERRVQVADAWEWVRGRNSFAAGFDWSRVSDLIASFANPDGTFLYDTQTSDGPGGGGLVNWITDYTFGVNAYPSGECRTGVGATLHYFCFRSYTQSFGEAETAFVTHHLAGYVEDAFRVGDLRLTVGARYEYSLLPFPQAPNGVLDTDLKQVATQVVGATSSFPEDRNNLGPRVSVAWAPRRGRVVTAHLGYGIFYGRLPGTTVRSALTNTALAQTTLQVRIRPTTVTACPQMATVGFGFPCAYDTAPPAAVAETSSAMLFASNFRLPMVQRATFSLEREVGKRVLVRASYAGAVAMQLQGSLDLNVAPSKATGSFVLQGGDGHPGLHSGETFVVPLYTARRWTQYGPVTAIVSNANATYHAGTVEARVQEVRGFAVRGSFTFSRAIDYGPQISGTPQVDGQFDPFTNGYDKGLSTLQFPRRFSGDAVYRVRVEGGPRYVRQALNGWRASAIAVAGSGAPYSYEISEGTYLAGGRETINGSGGATYLPTVGRNTLRLPARASVDLRVERGFAMRRGMRLNAFAEAFNLLNERNLTRVETRAFLPGTPVVTNGVAGPTPLVFQDAPTIASEGLTTPAFGAPTSSTNGVSRERELETGVRVEF